MTHYMYEWSVPIIEAAERKGIKVDKADGRNVTRSDIMSRIEKTNPSFIVLNGHGNESCFFGHENSALIGIDDAGIFSDRIVFSRACDCLRELGRESVEKDGCKSFIGYEFEFVNVRQTSMELRPRGDVVSQPIWEASNAVPLSLIKGSTVSESVDASHRKADNEMLRLIYSKEPWSREVLKAIIINDEGLGFHGDGSAKI